MDDNIFHVGTWAAAIDNDEMMWLSNYDYNGLYKYDIKMNLMEFAHRFRDVAIDRRELHGEMYIDGDNIMIFPLSDNKVRIYDKKKKVEMLLQLPINKEKYFLNTLLGDKVYITSDRREVCIFDTYNKNFIVKGECIESIQKILSNNAMVDYSITTAEAKILIMNRTEKILNIIDVVNGKIDKINLKRFKEYISKVEYFATKFWVLFYDSFDVCSFDRELKEVERYIALEEEYVDDYSSIPYTKMIQYNDNLILLNYHGKSIMKINFNDKTVEKLYEVGEELCKNSLYGTIYNRALYYNNDLLIVPERGLKILRYNESEGMKETDFGLKNSTKEVLEIHKNACETTGVLLENKNALNLMNFLDYIEHKN